MGKQPSQPGEGGDQSSQPDPGNNAPSQHVDENDRPKSGIGVLSENLVPLDQNQLPSEPVQGGNKHSQPNQEGDVPSYPGQGGNHSSQTGQEGNKLVPTGQSGNQTIQPSQEGNNESQPNQGGNKPGSQPGAVGKPGEGGSQSSQPGPENNAPTQHDDENDQPESGIGVLSQNLVPLDQNQASRELVEGVSMPSKPDQGGNEPNQTGQEGNQPGQSGNQTVSTSQEDSRQSQSNQERNKPSQPVNDGSQSNEHDIGILSEHLQPVDINQLSENVTNTDEQTIKGDNDGLQSESIHKEELEGDSQLSQSRQEGNQTSQPDQEGSNPGAEAGQSNQAGIGVLSDHLEPADLNRVLDNVKHIEGQTPKQENESLKSESGQTEESQKANQSSQSDIENDHKSQEGNIPGQPGIGVLSNSLSPLDRNQLPDNALNREKEETGHKDEPERDDHDLHLTQHTMESEAESNHEHGGEISRESDLTQHH